MSESETSEDEAVVVTPPRKIELARGIGARARTDKVKPAYYSSPSMIRNQRQMDSSPSSTKSGSKDYHTLKNLVTMADPSFLDDAKI